MRTGWWILLMASTLAAQPVVEAFVDPRLVSQGQSFTLEVRVTNGVLQSAPLVGFADFLLVSGPVNEQSFQFFNGLRSSVSSRSWTIRAKGSGRHIIPRIAVVVDGATYYTQPISLEVLPNAPSTAQGADEQSRNLFLVATVDKDEVYRGEQLTVTWTIYSQLNIVGTEIEALPDLTGFWTEELYAPDRLPLRQQLLNGFEYRSAVVRRIALFPTRSGNLVIEPLVLRIGVTDRGGTRSIFNRGRVRYRNLRSSSLSIRVKPIPAADRPEGYGGVVGTYTLTGGLDYTDVVQDDAVKLTLTVAGNGNFKALEPPIIELPAGLEVFDPSTTNETYLGDTIGGSRTFTYVIIPRRAEDFIIPEARFPYFNPETGRYAVGRVGPFTLNVIPRENRFVGTTGFSRREVALMGQDIRFVKSDRPRWLKLEAGRYTTGILFLNLATVLLFAAPWIGQRAQSLVVVAVPSLRVRRALPAALALIAKTQGDTAEMYGQFSRAVTVYLNRKLGQTSQEYISAEVEQLLGSHGVPISHQQLLGQILERAAAARFAPVKSGDVELDRKALRTVLTEIDSQWTA